MRTIVDSVRAEGQRDTHDFRFAKGSVESTHFLFAKGSVENRHTEYIICLRRTRPIRIRAPGAETVTGPWSMDGIGEFGKYRERGNIRNTENSERIRNSRAVQVGRSTRDALTSVPLPASRSTPARRTATRIPYGQHLHRDLRTSLSSDSHLLPSITHRGKKPRPRRPAAPLTYLHRLWPLSQGWDHVGTLQRRS